MQQPDLIGLRNSKVDMMSTKNQDMKGRKTQNAAPATDPNDYTTLSQVQDFYNSLKDSLDQIMPQVQNALKRAVLIVQTLITKNIRPPTDSLTALQITNSSGSTQIMNIDSIDNVVGITNLAVGNVRPGADSTTAISFTNFHATSSLMTLDTVTTGIAFGATKLVFWNQDPSLAQPQQVLNPYSFAYALTTPMTGIANTAPGNVFAQAGNVENLRVAYENLRKAFEDLRAKLQTSTFVK